MLLIIVTAIIAEAQGRGKYSRVAIKAELYAYYFELAAGIYPTSAADFEERIEEITACEINYDGDDILIDGTVEEDCEAMRRSKNSLPLDTISTDLPRSSHSVDLSRRGWTRYYHLDRSGSRCY